MLSSILLMAWPYQDKVLTSFRLATDYFMPDVFAGNATVTQIRSNVTSTGYELVYHCANCFQPEDADGVYGVHTTRGLLVLGHAQAFDAPDNAGCPAQISFLYHNNGYGMWSAPLDGVASPSYARWAATPGRVVAGSCP